MRGNFPASSRKQSRHSRRKSRGGVLKLKVEKNARGRATIPKDHNVPIHCRYNWFPCIDSIVTPCIDSQQDGTCDSLVAPQEKDTVPCQIHRKPDTNVTAWEERGLTCLCMRRGLTPYWNSSGIPSSMSVLERKPEVLTSAPDEDLGPGTDWREILRGSSQLAWRLDFPEATKAGPWVPCHNSKGTTSFLPQLEKNREILPSTRDKALFHCDVSREIPSSLLHPKRVLDTLDSTQEVSQHTCLHWRWSPRVPSKLKKSPVFPSSSRDEGPFPCFFGKGNPAGSSPCASRVIRCEDGVGDWFRET